ncbi:UDP-2,4-diacetamido-2,4,6-trideoxy-beta-L-altropyranose hydrolase [bacterium]|nr:UDP-2,4-diacetamido-2,4,6-trideoxy-beta-L-altropyranose hydrolase [bacterium]
MNFVFRTDASREIGTGHVMRCLALAHALRKQGAGCHFVTRELPGSLAGRIEGEGFAVTRLPAPQGEVPEGPPAHAHWAGVEWAQDAEETRAVLDGVAPDWLVVDHYAFDARWQREARPTGTRLMVIDDLADRPHEADLLLDQNLGRTATDYDGLVPESCPRMIGPRYALLRPEFAAARAEALAARAGRGLKRMLISMGGVDGADATSAVLTALRGSPLPGDLRITVIMGSNAPALERVKVLAQDMHRPTEVAVDVSDMAAHMAAADLAIGAAGATTWERCCLGLPSIIVKIADNQAEIAQSLVAGGAALYAGPLQAPNFAANLQEAVVVAGNPARLANLSTTAAAISDGDGVGRVLTAICPATSRFRDATREDSRRIWEWRNAGDKKFLFGGESTPYGAHDEWFCSALQASGRIMRILVLEALPSGYIRLDRSNRTSARVSICLALDARGKGFGQALLTEAERQGRALKLEGLDAEIHRDNVASRKIFAAAGYVQRAERNGFLMFHRELEG